MLDCLSNPVFYAPMSMHSRLKFFAFGLLVSFILAPLSFAGDNADKGEIRPTASTRPSLTSYKIQAGIDGEIYPVFANYASLQRQSDRTFGVVSVTLSNPTETVVNQRVRVQIPGWSDPEIQTVELTPGSTRTVAFAPAFLPRFYENHEITAATAHVTVSDLASNSLYETTVPVRLRSAEDMFWGNGFKYAPFIASWVTPHDHLVETVLSRAKQLIPDHRMPGYESWKNADRQEAETWREAQAIFNALQRMGLSYVKSSVTLGDHQGVSERVRMPHVSLTESSANCIDTAVTYASIFENLGMDADIVIVPGHAYAGVRVAEGSSKFLFIDVALTGRSTFEAAVSSAQNGMASHPPSTVTQVIVKNARSAGIYPMP